MTSAKLLIASIAAASIHFSASTYATEIEFTTGVGRTNNIARAAQDERSATIRSFGLGLAFEKSTRLLSAEILGDLSLLDYAGSFYPSEVTGTAAGRLRYSLLEERIQWVLEDSFGQTRRDPFSVTNPLNRENVNYMSTGPDVRIGVTGPTSMLISGRFTRVDYQKSPADTERFGLWLGAERELSQSTQLSLTASTEHISPLGDAALAAYDRSSGYLRYSRVGARSSISLEAGGNRVHGSEVGVSGPLLRMELSKEFGRFAKMSLRVGREYTDSGASLAIRSGAPVAPPGLRSDSLLQTARPYDHQFAQLDWNMNGRRTSLGLSGGWFDEDYPGSITRDRIRSTMAFRVSRAIGSRTEASIAAAFNHNNYRTPASDDENIDLRGSLSWSMGRKLRLEAAGEHYSYSSDSTDEAKETRYWLYLHYVMRNSQNAPRP